MAPTMFQARLERSPGPMRGGRRRQEDDPPAADLDLHRDRGAAGAAADDPSAQAVGAFGEEGAVLDVVAELLQVVGEGVLVVGGFDVGAAGRLHISVAVVFARWRRQPVVAVGAVEAGDVGVRHVRVGEADDDAAAGQQTLRLVATAAQQVGEADGAGRGRAVQHGLVVVGQGRIAGAAATFSISFETACCGSTTMAS